MILNYEIGKIYDSIFFCVEYFNRTAIQSNITSGYSDTQFMYTCYNEIAEDVKSVPPILEPFFFYKNEIPTALSCFFSKYFNSYITMDSFIKNIRQNRDQLLQNIIDTIFNSIDNTQHTFDSLLYSPNTLIDSINALDIPTQVKLQTSLLIWNYDHVLPLLTDTLQKVYVCVDKLHQKYNNNLSGEYCNIINNDKANLYHIFFQFNNSTQINVASISLLNQYIIFYKKNEDGICLLAGLKHEVSLSNRISDHHVSVQNFMCTCGNETRMAIISALIQYNELTSTQLSKIISCPVSTLSKHLEALHSNNIIYIHKRLGLQVFYKLNISYFKQVKINMSNFLDNIVKVQEKSQA